ncbi:MAG: SAF domain-containing protein [Actinomycetota bacterium]|jgi:hypothetical protein
MRWIPRVRIVFAHHPFAYWACVGTFSIWVAITINSALASAQHQRESWGRSEVVLVATRDLEPGQSLHGATTTREIPIALKPAAALSAMPDGATARQAIATGEVLVGHDIGQSNGPLALLPDHWLALVVESDNSPMFSVGDSAVVLAGGQIIATDALVVDVIDGSVVVGVPSDAAGAVADAANQHIATVALSANPQPPRSTP